ncbi:MAG: sensor domain-containing diguanylate cyclase [Desulfurispora sp.]|uniref:sensor domain-containing diguanylate cyclase n=1 Tax=Desulfurispora sp. TaxID=3014275 RepID=UPI00404AC86E
MVIQAILPLHNLPLRPAPVLLIGIALAWLLARANYVLFHTLVELFCVIIAGMLALTGALSYFQTRNRTLLLLSCGYLCIGLTDLWHTLAYQGLQVIGQGANTATQLWVLGRLLEVTLLLTVTRPISNRAFPVILLTGATFTTLGWATILYWPVFPPCFIPGSGLTAFKIAAEYLVMVCAIAAFFLLQRAPQLPPPFLLYLRGALLFTVLSEFFFTLYWQVADLYNFAGHIGKLISYALLAWGIIIQSLYRPLDTLYSQLCQQQQLLREASEKDALTGLLNRQALQERLTQLWRRHTAERLPICLLMLDLDHFKTVNDRFGHHSGDLVLQKTAALLKSQLRQQDLLARYGGEEFLAVLPGATLTAARVIAERLRLAVGEQAVELTDGQSLLVTISGGLVQARRGENWEQALERADQLLYQAKQRGRNRVESEEGP